MTLSSEDPRSRSDGRPWRSALRPLQHRLASPREERGSIRTKALPRGRDLRRGVCSHCLTPHPHGPEPCSVDTWGLEGQLPAGEPGPLPSRADGEAGSGRAQSE